MWTVYATAPSNTWNTGWDFRDGYFPREVYGKVYAEALASEARRKGGKDVRVEKATKEQQRS